MKIAFVVNSFPNLSETFILNQITGLIDLKHEVDIYTRFAPPKNMAHEDIEKYGLHSRIRYLDTVPENKLARLLKVFKLLLRNIRKIRKSPLRMLSSLNFFRFGKDALSLNFFYAALPFTDRAYDIIHCHFGPNGNYGAMLKKMGIGLKLVTMFHGHDIRKGLVEGAHIYQPLFNAGDCFLANSSYTHQHLIDFGADPEKIIYHPVGIDVQKFANRSQRTLTGVHDSITILTVARLVYEKGLSQGIHAIRNILEKKPSLSLRYNIVGEGPMAEELKNIVDALDLKGTVRFLGGMVQREVISELEKADLFLLPSVEEAFGVVLLEAQAMGIPVVATDVGSVRQAIKEGESGYLVQPNDPDALAQRLIDLIESQHRWHEMGTVGRKFVEENYDIKNLNRRLVNIYEDLFSR